jgi:hypothetical protein
MVMVIDTSAIAAILFDEPDAGALEEKIADDPVRLMSAASLLEATIVIEARPGDPGGREFDLCCTGQRSKYSRWTPTRPTWPGQTSGRPQLWRLLFLCAGGHARRAIAVQGRRFHKD